MKKKWRVSKAQSGMKLLEFLSHYEKNSSNKALKKQIEKGAVKLNGVMERFASKVLKEGEWVQYQPLLLDDPAALSILFEDADLLVVNKPAGIPCDASFKISGKNYTLVHRLDKETSGVLLLAKTKQAEESLKEAFKTRSIRKLYWAVVDGAPQQKQGLRESRLGKIASFSGQSLYGSVKEGGLSAITGWKVLKEGKKACLLECNPETGRTHQIRVHLAEMGHPILGDVLYGRTVHCPFRPNGMLLHARSVELRHPVNGNLMQVVAPPPKYFEEALQALW